MKLLHLTFATILVACPIGTAQTSETPAEAATPGQSGSRQPLAFDVATIKPVDQNKLNDTGVRIFPGGRVVIRNVSLKGLIQIAFATEYRQVSGCSDWCERENYDVEAKPPDDMEPPISNLHYSFWEIDDPRLRQMLQELLMDRFQLRIHAVSQTGTVYVLKRNGKPFPLHTARAAQANPVPGGNTGRYEVDFANGRFYLFNTSMPQLAQFASTYVLHAPVQDRTGLTGFFDYKSTMQVDPSTQQNDFEGSFIQLLSEIGLELKKQKGPVEAFVVDHAEKSSPN